MLYTAQRPISTFIVIMIAKLMADQFSNLYFQCLMSCDDLVYIIGYEYTYTHSHTINTSLSLAVIPAAIFYINTLM